MAKFVKTNSSGKIEICIKKINHDSHQNLIRKHNFVNYQSRFNKEYNSESWVKVVFSDGANFDHEWIRQELQKAATGPTNHRECILQIYNYRISSDSAILFLKLTNISYGSFKSNCSKIPHPHSGQPCDVIVMSVENPETPSSLPEKWVDVLKDSLSFRYNSDEKSLNLSNFTEDSHLNSRGLWFSLSRPAIVKSIVSLLQTIENFVLEKLDLSDNGLCYIAHFVPLFETIPIRNIDLSRNNLNIKSLFKSLLSSKYLSGLIIRGDRGFCGQRIKNQSEFVAELIENCPTIERFNESDLSTDMFGLPARLPVTKRVANEGDQLLLNFFLEHAGKLETNRDELIDYYSSESVLTLSACYHDMSTNNRRLSEVYLRNSRNLERLKDETRRNQLVKRGSAQILGLLSEIPRLKHIAESLSVDSIVNADQSKVFVVNGLFVECLKIPNHRGTVNNENGGNFNNGNTGNTHNVFNVRMFSRAMFVVPPGKILQENWTLTNPTDYLFRKYREKFEEIRDAFDAERSDKKTEDSSKNSQEQMVDSFCQFSNMNKFYSQQCLQECSWDVEKAKQIFQQALNNGKIPPEAFQK